MVLSLYSFSKRQNSTSVPTGGTDVDVTLKRETSLNAPTFILQSANRPTATYASFEGAYYFIDNVRSMRNDIWALECRLDVLATYRAQINATSAFVEYAAGGNSQIPDQRFEIEYGVAGVNMATAAVFPGSLTLAAGSKFITVLGQTSAETFYIADANLARLFSSIAQWSENTIDRTSLETILDTGLRQLIGSGSAADCVRDAYCLPCGPIPATLGGAESIYLGMFNTGVTGNKISGSGDATEISSISIPHQYSDWRKQSPYEIVQLFLPLYGTINIPSDIAADSSALSIECRLNVRSGDFTYYVTGSGRSGKEITVGGNCAAPLAVGASNINPAGSMGAIASGLTSAAFGNVAGVAASSLHLLSPVPQSVGATGGISNKYPNAQCMVYYRNTSGAPGSAAATQGIPLFAQRQLSSLSGYVKTRGASVAGNIRGVLREQINMMLDDGIFLE